MTKEEIRKEMETYLPYWKELKKDEQEKILQTVTFHHAKKGTIVHRAGQDCVGLLVLVKGQFRSYIVSEEGKEITVFRLYERDMCLFSVSCFMRNIDFDLWVEAKEDTDYWVMDADTYEMLLKKSMPVLAYTNELLSARFSDVMWMVDQIMNKSVDNRLAAFLIQEANEKDTNEVLVTHDRIARELGTAREVVSRTLKYLNQEGLISSGRGRVKIQNYKGLYQLAKKSLR